MHELSLYFFLFLLISTSGAPLTVVCFLVVREFTYSRFKVERFKFEFGQDRDNKRVKLSRVD